MNFPCSALDLQLTGDHYVRKLSAIGQSTRPTQPFILSGSINDSYAAVSGGAIWWTLTR